MKTKKIHYALILGLLLTSYTCLVKSQSCGMYYPMVNGTEYEMTTYNTNDQITGKSISKISDVVTSDAGTTATILVTSKDKKDAVTGTSSCSIKCTGTGVYIDMKSYVSQQTMNQWKDMTVKTDAGQMEIPQTLSVGMTLKDATITVSAYNSGGTLFSTMKISITNRLVASQETITTTAGTFSCYKITQDIKMENIMMGITIPVNMKSAEYYAAGTGMVKSQSYDKNGKLVGYSLLTKITKP